MVVPKQPVKKASRMQTQIQQRTRSKSAKKTGIKEPMSPVSNAYNSKIKKPNSRQTSVKRSIKGKPGGYEIVNVSQMMDDISI